MLKSRFIFERKEIEYYVYILDFICLLNLFFVGKYENN